MKGMREVLADVREQIKTAGVRGETSQGGEALNVTDNACAEIADFIEAQVEKQAAIVQLQDFQDKRAQARMTPGETIRRAAHLKQASRRQALRNLGFAKAANRGLNPLDILWPGNANPALKLAEFGAGIVSELLGGAIEVAFNPYQTED